MDLNMNFNMAAFAIQNLIFSIRIKLSANPFKNGRVMTD